MVRVRIAPSPTGSTHVGLVRSALFNQLFSEKNNGKFILRIEDTDLERSTKESERAIISDLKWAGIKWDEGPDCGGPFAPYRQSERLEKYKKLAFDLVKNGKAYYCFCSDEVLEEKRKKALAEGKNPHYDGTCRNIDLEEAKKRINNGEKPVIRFKVPYRDYKIDDLVRGEVIFDKNMVGDFIILRSNEMPTYNFAVVVDDIDMQITHVFRGEEHLSNTPRQLMLYEAFNKKAPEFGHLSILLGKDRQKLSKRHGATSVLELRKMGILPQSLLNYLLLLGWSPGSNEEFFTYEEMVKRFDVKGLIKHPQMFDMQKLLWLNHEYIQKFNDNEIFEYCYPYFKEKKYSNDREFLRRLAIFCKEAIFSYEDIDKRAYYVVNDEFEYDTSLLKSLDIEKTYDLIIKYKQEINKLKFTDKLILHNTLKKVGKELKLKGKALFLPLRLALTGKEEGPGIYDLIIALGVINTSKRLERFLEYIKNI